MPEETTADRASGQSGVSEALRRFTEELPYERRPVLAFVSQVARTTAPAARVLDLGAGNAPYRELFGHTEYTTSDWSHSPHSAAAESDIVGPADALPVADGSYDLVLCTQVLEHVPEPRAVLAECHRMLTAGGRVAVTVPLLWELHELPYDFYRFTGAGVSHLLEAAGFVELDVRPHGDSFGSVAQLMRNVGWQLGEADDEYREARVEARQLLQQAADAIARLEPLDLKRVMPLGFCATARRP